MSKYTTEVRFICEKAAGYDESVGYDKIEEILEKSWKDVFSFAFPIFDENYRSVLCKKILKHYYTREIGFETVGLWKLKLDMAMNEIMPYYNKLYETELIKFNPIYDADYTKTHEGEDAGEGAETGKHTGTIADEGSHTGTVTDEGSHTGTVSDEHEHGGSVGDSGTHTGTIADAGTHGGTITDEGSKDSTDNRVRNEQLSESTWDVYSDTPQGALTNVDQNTYLTNARKISHDSELDVTDDDIYRETNGNERTFNETNGNTRTFNEGQGNLRTYNETNDNTRTYDEDQENTRTFDEEQDNTKTFNEGTQTDRTYSNTNQYVEHVVGKFPGKSYASLIKEFRDNLLNIDVDIIGELSDLFIKLW